MKITFSGTVASIVPFVEGALKAAEGSALTLTIQQTPQGDCSALAVIDGSDGISDPLGSEKQQTISKAPHLPKPSEGPFTVIKG